MQYKCVADFGTLRTFRRHAPRDPWETIYFNNCDLGLEICGKSLWQGRGRTSPRQSQETLKFGWSKDFLSSEAVSIIHFALIPPNLPYIYSWIWEVLFFLIPILPSFLADCVSLCLCFSLYFICFDYIPPLSLSVAVLWAVSPCLILAMGAFFFAFSVSKKSLFP